MRPLPAALLCCLVAAGCGDKDAGPISTASYDPEAMAKAAVAQYDKNGNGAIEGAELDACPGLKSALASIDGNNDRKLSIEELTSRFNNYRAAGAVGYPVRVTLDGNPLADATVTLTPEAFMGGTVKEATGPTDPDGSATTFTADGRQTPGLAPGVYRVAVTKPGTAIPERYSAQTTLGCEVSAGGRGAGGGIELKLTSR